MRPAVPKLESSKLWLHMQVYREAPVDYATLKPQPRSNAHYGVLRQQASNSQTPKLRRSVALMGS